MRRRRTSKDRPVPEVQVSFRRLLSYMRPYWLRMIFAFVGLALASLVGLVFPLVIRDLLDTVLDEGSRSELNQLALGLLGVFALQAVFRFVQGYQLGYVGERVVLDLREQLFHQLTRLSLGFYGERRTGELVSRVSSDATRLRNVVTSDVTSALSQAIVMTGSLVLMVAINWRLMSFIVVLVPLIVAIGTIFGMWLRRISSDLQDSIAESTVVVEETISGIRVVKSFARENYENRRFVDSQRSIFGVALRLLRVRNTFGPLMAFIGFGSLAGFLWFGGREVLAGRLTVGELVAFMFYGVNVAASVTTFVSLYASIQEAIGATKRIFEIIDTPPDVDDAPNAITMPTVTGQIAFEKVSFAYVPGTTVLQDIQLIIEPGESLALVGPSGAGKTTLFNLIPRFYDPIEGRVCIDGIDLRTITQESLRTQIGLVPQDTQLFGGNVRDNIRYGRLDASEDDIIAAAQAANAHEFILALPNGYDTLVGERGVKLSGGQRQRVAIARAILKDPRILLLDEATSSLDSESEGLVQEALDRLMLGRTTVIIAHRLSTIRAVDRIAVLDAGRIVELGTHEALVSQDGLYARLYNMQFREQNHDTKTSANLVGAPR